MYHCRGVSLLLVLGLSLSGCGIAKFDEFAATAPAARISGSGERFGRLSAGLVRMENDEDGGRLIVGSTEASDIRLATISYDETGRSERDDATSNQLFDPGNLDLAGGTMRSMAPLPFAEGIGELSGPFAYLGVQLGTLGRVFLLDALRFERSGQPLEFGRATVERFGTALAPARLNGAASMTPDGSLDLRQLDLAVGGSAAVVLFRHDTVPGNWIDRSGDLIVGDGPADDRLPQEEVRGLVAANLNPSSDEDEIVVGVPGGNYVGIIDDVAGTPRIRKLPLPANAELFGRAVLVANLDSDLLLEVVVSAPGTNGNKGSIYVYKLRQEFFDNGMDPSYFDDNDATNRKMIEILAPDGAIEFGTHLAFGKFDGTGENLLAVSGPKTPVKNIENAGRIYLYRTDLSDPQIVQLSSPDQDEFLGEYLSAMPFVAAGFEETILVASARASALVFFAGLTEEHRDVRQ